MCIFPSAGVPKLPLRSAKGERYSVGRFRVACMLYIDQEPLPEAQGAVFAFASACGG